MKKLLLVAILALIVFLALPYITGRVAETVTLQLAEQVNATQSEYGSLEIKNYSRSLRSTKSSFSWSPPAEMSAVFSESIVYNCDGSHGLMSYSYECQAEDVPEYTDFVNSQLGGIDPITIGGEISVFGTATQAITVDAFSVQDENGESMTIKPAKFELATDENLTTFELSGKFEGMEMLSGDQRLQLRPVELDGQMKLNAHKLLIGEVTFSASGLQMTSPEDGAIELNGIEFASVTKEQGESMVMAYSLSADHFKQNAVDDSSGAEGERFDDLVLDMQMSGIHMATFAAITKRLQELAKYDQPGALNAEQESTRNAQMLAILPELEDLFIKGLELNIDLGADHNDGPIKGRLNIELLDALSLGDMILLSVQPDAFFRKLDARLSSSIPADFIESSEKNANALAASAWYKRNGDQYESDFQVSEDGIKLNGNKMSVEELIGAFSN